MDNSSPETAEKTAAYKPKTPNQSNKTPAVIIKKKNC